MSASDSIGVPVHPTAARFTTTLWTQVLAAPRNEKALASLCRKYWYPLYAFLRRKGVSSHEAEDLTQGFFVHLLSKQGLETVRREYGKFRSFLLASLQTLRCRPARSRHGGKTLSAVSRCSNSTPRKPRIATGWNRWSE